MLKKSRGLIFEDLANLAGFAKQAPKCGGNTHQVVPLLSVYCSYAPKRPLSLPCTLVKSLDPSPDRSTTVNMYLFLVANPSPPPRLALALVAVLQHEVIYTVTRVSAPIDDVQHCVQSAHFGTFGPGLFLPAQRRTSR